MSGVVESAAQAAGTTAQHAKYFAWELTRRRAASEEDRLAQSLFDASVDLNPHQIEAAHCFAGECGDFRVRHALDAGAHGVSCAAQ